MVYFEPWVPLRETVLVWESPTVSNRAEIVVDDKSGITITIASKKSRNIEYIYSYMLYQ